VLQCCCAAVKKIVLQSCSAAVLRLREEGKGWRLEVRGKRERERLRLRLKEERLEVRG